MLAKWLQFQVGPYSLWYPSRFYSRFYSTIILIYVNDFNCAIRYCSVHHFPDDTNLLNYNNSVNRMNKQVKKDLKNLRNWLNTNKICLNVSKTEVILFKITDVSLKLKLNGKDFTLPTQSNVLVWKLIKTTGNNRFLI